MPQASNPKEQNKPFLAFMVERMAFLSPALIRAMLANHGHLLAHV